MLDLQLIQGQYIQSYLHLLPNDLSQYHITYLLPAVQEFITIFESINPRYAAHYPRHFYLC